MPDIYVLYKDTLPKSLVTHDRGISKKDTKGKKIIFFFFGIKINPVSKIVPGLFLGPNRN